MFYTCVSFCSQEVSVQGVSVQGASVQGSLSRGGLCPGVVSVQGVVYQGDPSVRWRAGSKHPTGMHFCITVLLDVFDIVWIIRFKEIFTSQKCCITVHAKMVLVPSVYVRAPVCLFTGPGPLSTGYCSQTYSHLFAIKHELSNTHTCSSDQKCEK